MNELQNARDKWEAETIRLGIRLYAAELVLRTIDQAIEAERLAHFCRTGKHYDD